MFNKFLVLIVLVSLNVFLLPGQTIHYDYDNSGNRLTRYIILQKSNNTTATLINTTGKNSSKSLTEDSKMADFEEKLEEMTIKIFPNPTKGQLTVAINGIGPDETADYQLFSQAGRLVDTKRGNGNEFTVDMERYPSGLYILRLMIRGKISQWKILKE
jgi:hypothetical protein